MQILKKMSVATLNSIRGGFKDVTETRLVGRIFGIVSGVETKETTIGASLKFTGEFRGINGDGEEFMAPVCYLIEPAAGMLAAAFAGAEGRPVNFGFDIFVSPKEKRSPVDLGYEYQIKPLLETRASDPMLALMSSANAPAIPAKPKQPQLTGIETPAPAPAPTEAHASAPTAASAEAEHKGKGKK